MNPCRSVARRLAREDPDPRARCNSRGFIPLARREAADTLSTRTLGRVVVRFVSIEAGGASSRALF